jgi:hypothetical protein
MRGSEHDHLRKVIDALMRGCAQARSAAADHAHDHAHDRDHDHAYGHQHHH